MNNIDEKKKELNELIRKRKLYWILFGVFVGVSMIPLIAVMVISAIMGINALNWGETQILDAVKYIYILTAVFAVLFLGAFGFAAPAIIFTVKKAKLGNEIIRIEKGEQI